MDRVGIEDIVQAMRRIHPYVHRTPVLTSSLLNKWLGHEVWFKAECFQKVGAFKARGACNTIAWLIESGKKPLRLVSNSSGNHAQAVAWSAGLFGIPSAIYMPENASIIKIQATKSYGAQVVLCKSREIADEEVRKASEEEGTYCVPPFNHEQVIAGQGTAVFEALQELGNANAVFAPCGGGGLLSGSYIATKALSPEAAVIGAEPLNGNDAAESLRKSSIQKLTKSPDTIADGARTLAVGDITFEFLKKLDAMYEVEEEWIIYWTQWLSHLLKIHVEPTSAMAMEAAFRWLSHQKSKKKVVVVLSGGNIDNQTAQKIWQTNHLQEVPHL